MTLTIDVEDAGWNAIPALEELTRRAAEAAFAAAGVEPEGFDTSILFAGDETVKDLNARWRGKDTATNVLSFPAPEGVSVPAGEAIPLGDIALAFGVVAREAAEQGKALPDHATHLIIHGLLHLLGYDHESEDEAGEMEGLETEILKGLGIPDPYERD
jgi:probable rRNA maturation factor